MVERRDPVDRVVDLIVAVPVSIAAAVREIVPIDTRRLERVIGRNLELIGRYAKRGAAGPEAREHTPVRVTPARTLVRVAPPGPESPSSEAPATSEHTIAETEIPLLEDEIEAGLAVELPIAGYDQLSARQIVDRLDALTSAELALIEAHERENRRRQTVLGRIGQLA